MEILNGMDIVKGKKASRSKTRGFNLTQPLQFLEKKYKDDEWLIDNLEWLEWTGLKQIRRNAHRLLKNYKLANGIIDKTDYIPEECDEMGDLVTALSGDNDDAAYELKFYPIVPNIINVLVSEFSKRESKVVFKATDDTSYNEMLDSKYKDIEKTLLQDAEKQLLQKLVAAGMPIEGPEAEEATSQEVISQLPQIQEFYNNSYVSIQEEWATHQYRSDLEKFNMDELEEIGFKDSLIADREFWHFNMMDGDYDIEIWNPIFTYYVKSPETRYISDGTSVGKIEMMTIPSVVDKYGYLMNEEQLASLETYAEIKDGQYIIGGSHPESFYEPSRSHDWNVNLPSIGMRQFATVTDFSYDNDIISWILGEVEDFQELNVRNLVRVSTNYWKTQIKVGHLTKITESGEVIKTVVSEDYKIYNNPIYNNEFETERKRENLVFGEHIDWTWINETMGGVKIGPNQSTYGIPKDSSDMDGLDSIYLGINKPKPGRLKYQFKGETTLYGCKLPVEGRVFSDRNSRSISLVDRAKPFQVGYNIVNNQIADIIIDEIGTVIVFDQNALPKHSMGQDWQRGDLSQAYVAMKDFSMLPLDTTLSNTENAMNFQHYQKLDMSETQRLMSRIQLSNYFKQSALEVVGVSPQRLGQQLGQTDTATGIEQSVAGSYNQTEVYFTQHSDHLMPRVHQMRTDLAQFYQSNNPSVRLQYLSTEAQKVNFEMLGTDLLLRDFNIYSITKTNQRDLLEKMRNLALSNNTSGASIFDLGNIILDQSLVEIKGTLKEIETKVQKQKQAELQQAQQMQEQQIQANAQEKQLERDHKAIEAEKERRKDLLVAEIKAAGYGAMQDINQNQQSDFQDALQDVQKTEQYQDTMSLKREQDSTKKLHHSEKMNLEREKLAAKKEIAEKQLKIARENKNKYDVPSKERKNK